MTDTGPTPDASRRTHPSGRRIRALVLAPVVALAALLIWATATFAAEYADANGAPVSVVAATWMRDNHLGWAAAKLEDLYYSYVDRAEVGGDPTVSADLVAEDAQGADTVDAVPVATPSIPPPPLLSGRASAAPSPSPSPSPSTSVPPPTASAPSTTGPSTPTPTHLTPPPTLVSPAGDPQPKEGVWQPVASRVNGVPAIYATRVRVDDVHTSYYASLMWIDTSLTRAMYVPGYEEPGGPNPYDGALPEELWPDVLANINGAFRMDGSMGGYVYEGTEVRPLVDGRATMAFYSDGSMRIGKWGRDVTMTDDVVVARQNLNLIVDRGESQVTNDADHVIWGPTTDKESLAWRSALGQRADGSLVYVGSPYLSAATLANALVSAGVQRAIVLDMNDWWVAGFYFRHQKDGTPLCRRLDPAIQEGCDRFLHPYKRDSIQFLADAP
jgi:hypothetical protein